MLPDVDHTRCRLVVSRLMLSLSALALLSACGGGGGGDGEGVDGTFYAISPDPSGEQGIFGSYYMRTITDEWRAAAANIRDNLSRYKVQGGDVTVNGKKYYSNPLYSSRVDYAHAVGLTGKGQVIAIVDDGFRQSHEVFAGKSNTDTGSAVNVDEHGTMVASIAAGNSGTMVGVAPGADLVFGTYETADTASNSSSSTVSYGNLRRAAEAATERNAVVQNNSWGFVNAPISNATYNSIFSTADARSWRTALRTYAQTGVVVFAISNDENATTAGLMDALPVIETSLEKSWIAVGNAVPIFDDDGVTGVARRESASCMEAARWCIFTDGYWYAATDSSDRSYEQGTGTSFSAPTVSGALALLAEAFPYLSNHQLRARLLASADNDFEGFEAAGTVDLLEGDGVYEHAYSTEYGHGFLDIRAALLPIGGTTLRQADGSKVDTKDFGFTTGGALGDAVVRSLEGVDLAVSDALGGGFEVAAKSFAAQAEVGSLAETVAARSRAKDYRASRTARLKPLSETFAAHSGQTVEVNSLDGRSRAAVLMTGEDSYGIAVSRSLTDGDFRVEVGVKLARDDGSVMGFSDAEGRGGADMVSVTLGLSQDIGDAGFFALSGEIGVADLAAPAALRDVSSARFDSVRLDVGSRSVFSAGDRIALGVAMPVTVTSGSASMEVPVSTGMGRSEIRSLDVDLAPRARQVDLSISYQAPLDDRTEFLLELAHAENYGNVEGLSDSAAILGVKWSF